MLLFDLLPLEIHHEHTIYRSQSISPISPCLALRIDVSRQIIYSPVIEMSLIAVLLQQYMSFSIIDGLVTTKIVGYLPNSEIIRTEIIIVGYRFVFTVQLLQSISIDGD